MSEIYKALIKAQGEFPAIDLNKTVGVWKNGKHLYDFDYATLTHIKKLTDPVLKKNGLGIIHVRDGGNLVSRLIHTSGEFIESSALLRIPDGATQQQEGSVVSYQKRYNHVGLLGVVAESDDDANIADEQEVKEPAKPKSKADKFPAVVNKYRTEIGSDKVDVILEVHAPGMKQDEIKDEDIMDAIVSDLKANTKESK